MGVACYPKQETERFVICQRDFKYSPKVSWDIPVALEVKKEFKPVYRPKEDSGTNEKYKLPPAKKQSSLVLPTSPVPAVETKVSYRKNTDALFEAMMGNKSLGASLGSPYSTRTTVDSFKPIPMTQVLPHLYIGSYDDTINEKNLRTNGITHILSLIGRTSSAEWLKHKIKPMNDYGKTDLKSVLKEVEEFMEQGQKDGNSLLVHCQSGQNRSATVVIAYLMMNCQKTLFLSHKELKDLRPIVQINVKYAKQLLELEKELFGENSLPANWMERGTIDEENGEIRYKYENMTMTQHARVNLNVSQ